MSIKIEEFFRKISLPKRYINDKFNIREKYREEAAEYLKLLEEIDGSEFEGDKKKEIQQRVKEVKDAVKENIDSINNVFTYHEGANPKKAQEEIDCMMERMKDEIFVASIDDLVGIRVNGTDIYISLRMARGNQFYRIRAVEEKTVDIQENPNELFHIPLSQKALVNNERFSLAGFPGLYLSSALPLAWQEGGYPRKYYYSEFQYEKLYKSERKIENELRFLALYSPNEINIWGLTVKYNDFDLWLEVISRYMKQYPLILACAFVNHSGKVSYKQEYIVPQMLMQWVQRNNTIIQGISYFTCIDLNTQNNGWCGHNVVIPACGPYDENGYSEKLKEDFEWSRPEFYEIPLIDRNSNEFDRECLYALIERIRGAVRVPYLPDKYRDYLLEMLELCCCLYNILKTSNTMNMELAVNIMSVLDYFYKKINKSKADKIISEVNKEKDALWEPEKLFLEESNIEFEKIVKETIGTNRDDGVIKKLIDKYTQTMWNYLNCGSKVTILYIDKRELEDVIDWMHEEHFLYFLRKLDSDDNTVNYLKNVCEETNFNLKDLWGKPVGDDEWMKEHMANIKTPIFVKTNEISIYSQEGAKPHDYIQVGFDEHKLKENLLK